MSTEPTTRPLSMPPIPDGHRVRYCVGKWWTDRDSTERTLRTDWMVQEWAAETMGTTIPRAEARAWGHFDMPADANLILFDGHTRPTWVKASALDDVGMAEAAPVGGVQQTEMTF